MNEKNTGPRKVYPCLWFHDNNCAEAVNYYTQVFPNSRIEEIVYYPDERLDEHFAGMNGKVLTAEFTLDGAPFMGFDGGPYFQFSEAISLVVTCQDQAEIDYYWERLSHVPEAAQCGWAKDRFGLSWQIVPANMNELMRSEAQVKAFMQMAKIDIATLEALA